MFEYPGSFFNNAGKGEWNGVSSPLIRSPFDQYISKIRSNFIITFFSLVALPCKALVYGFMKTHLAYDPPFND